MSTLNADRWLYTTLTNDTALQALIGKRVYIDTAPENVEYPFVILQAVYGSPVANMQVDIIMDDEVWMVKAVGEGNSYISLEPIVERIKALLHKTSGTGVIGSVREEVIRFSEIYQGETFKHLGHYYRIYTQ